MNPSSSPSLPPPPADRIVTVFGGSGFLGRHVVARLARHGCRLRIGVRRPQLAGFLKPMGEVGQIELCQVNLRDRASTAAALEGAWGVVNLVGILRPGGRQTFSAIHADAPAHLAAAAADAGVRRFVHLSALGCETDSPARYAGSKAVGEAGVRRNFPDADILRPSVVFGPEDQFFNRFAALARLFPVLPIIGAGTRLQPVHVGDVAEAVCRLLHRDAADGRIYELGGPDIRTLRELMSLMLGWINRRRLIVALPERLALPLGYLFGWMPGSPFTADQVRLLRRDNIVSAEATARRRDLPGLGITPTPMAAIVPACMERFRPVSAGRDMGIQAP